MNLAAVAGILASLNGSAAFNDQVFLRVVSPSLGTAFLYSFAGGCLALTADHVVEGGHTVKMTDGAGAEFSGAITTEWKSRYGIDVAAVKITNLSGLACPARLNLKDLSTALQQPVGLIVSLDVTNTMKRIAVTLDGVDGNELVLRPLFSDDSAYASLSGSPVYFNDLPVGVVVRASSGRIYAAPLLALANATPTAFEAPVDNFRPFDTRDLPQDVQEAVAAADQARAQAENAAKNAAEAAQQGLEAARKADEGVSGYRNYATPSGRFRGEATEQGVQIIPNGYGVATTMGGIRDGDLLEGSFSFQDKGAMSLGVWLPAQNENNRGGVQSYSGEFSDGTNTGYGVTTSHLGAKWYGKVVNGTAVGPTVWVSPNGDRLEVSYNKNGEAEGIGAEWDSKGQLTHCGTWRGGEFVGPTPGCPAQ